MIPRRLLLGAGPSPVPERVLAALAQPTIGHMDPAFGEMLAALTADLRVVFGTSNPATLPLSATGSGGMEALSANFVAPGERVVCGVCGAFGERLADSLRRAGADVVRVEAGWGRAIDPQALVDAAEGGATRMIVVVHGETSTGICQPLDGLADWTREHDALLAIDCVTSLAGHPLALDDAGVDVAFSGTQKCLNVPPGLSPFSAGERALSRLRGPSRSWYFDLELLLGYWLQEGGRSYHHTPPINSLYALAEGLRIVLEEGLAARWERHRIAHGALRDALGVFGFERLAPDGEELWPLLAVTLPEGVSDSVRGELLERHGIEVSGGLGPLAGRAWRVGVMGEGARVAPQRRLVEALGDVLGRDPAPALDALEAAWAPANV